MLTALILAAAAATAPPDATATAKLVGVPAEPVLHGPPAAAREILAAERAFAARAAQAGAPAAMREFMEPTDSRSFDGGAPFRGAEAISRMPEWGAPIVWAPAEVFASSGDMGLDWGRWRATLPGGAAVTGVYITTWRKGADGRWRGLIDSGVPDAAPPPATPATTPATAPPGATNLHAARPALDREGGGC